MVPILNRTVHKQILYQIMVANLKDNIQSWMMSKNGKYKRIPNENENISAHEYFMSES